MNSADLCRKNNWKVGDILVGDEGYGADEIKITAIGEENILARCIKRESKSVLEDEGAWELFCRDWKKLNEQQI